MFTLENNDVGHWKMFSKNIRLNGCHLLKNINHFPDAILVAGVQRSGTTALTRAIVQSSEIEEFQVNRDDELDAALILSGYVDYRNSKRHCFQTTYLNECYEEYISSNTNFKLVWVVRNPLSVVRSMVYNWKRFALNELFNACGKQALKENRLGFFDYYGYLGNGVLKKACYAYNGKADQLLFLQKKLPMNKLVMVDYDKLIENPDCELLRLFNAIGLDYKNEYSDMIRPQKTVKYKSRKLSKTQASIVNNICTPTYNKIIRLINS